MSGARDVAIGVSDIGFDPANADGALRSAFRYPCPLTIETFVDVIIHIVIVVAALTVMFQQFLSKKEWNTSMETFENGIDTIMIPVQKGLHRASDSLPCDARLRLEDVLEAFRALYASDTPKDDPVIQKNQRLVAVNVAIVTVVGLSISVLVGIIGAVHNRYKMCNQVLQAGDSCYVQRIRWGHIATNNLIVVTVVLLFEAFFIFTVATRYIPSSQAVVGTTIIDRLKLHGERIRKDTSGCRDCNPMPPPAHVGSKPGVVVGSILGAVAVIVLAGWGTAVAKRRHLELPAARDRVLHGVDRYVLPLIGGCAMVSTVTIVYFTFARHVEQQSANRQAEILTDYVMREVDAATQMLPPNQARAVDRYLVSEIDRLDPASIPNDQKDIDRKNAPAVLESIIVMAIVGGVLVALVIAGAVLQKTRTSAPSANAALRLFLAEAAGTLVLGAGIAFVCEFGFLNLVIARFEATSPAMVIHNSEKALFRAIDTSGCRLTGSQ